MISNRGFENREVRDEVGGNLVVRVDALNATGDDKAVETFFGTNA